MVKSIGIAVILTSLVFLFSCSTQTEDEQIIVTSKNFITAIKNDDIKKVNYLIGIELSVLGKDIESLQFDINKCRYLLKTYSKGKDVEIIVTDQINELGQKLVKVPIFDGYDSTTKLTKASLNIYFGPPDMVPLSKISGYEVDTHYDSHTLSDTIRLYR